MEDILVSINCITYNHGKYIRQALESFLMQKTNFKYEILVHDDASKDETSEILKEYKEKYPDIVKVILQEENQMSKGINNVNYTFNHCRSQGKYIAICEGDDFWTDENKLQKQVDYMEKNPECGLCFHTTDVFRNEKKVGEIKPYNENCIAPSEDIILGGGSFIGTNSIMYRKQVLDDAPDFYVNAIVSDYPLQMITSTKQYAYYINESMSVYRRGVKGSWTTTMKFSTDSEEKQIKHLEGTIKLLDKFNSFTNYKYSDAVRSRIKKCEFDILRLEGNLKALKSEEYISLYRKTSTVSKIRVYMKLYTPNLYNGILNVIRKCV
ncbi:glycosyltransferase [Clostridium sp.]|uniref:glycosyltransferase n=1 Tax=Clostridium sp. TaxID=1506 RepID=UPI001B569B67|nr:glycosyltransferase [Clostridium sp.]MBP3917178.1 glycosyltransferase [Clostridium sp.]